MKIIISENQLSKILKESKSVMALVTFVKDLDDEIIDVEVDGDVINVTVDGEGYRSRKEYFKKKIGGKLQDMFSKKFKIEINFEDGDFVADIKISKLGKEFNVQFEKVMKDGKLFELEGTLRQYSSGRSDEYEFEPDSISDEEYYSKHWELIDELIDDELNNFMIEKNKSKS